MTVEIEGGRTNLPPHVSWSSFESWLRCGKSYELSRIVRVEQRPGWAAIGGSAVHAMTEALDMAQWQAERAEVVAQDRAIARRAGLDTPTEDER